MMKFLRSQSQTVLVVVLGVIGLGFLFYGNAGNLITSTGAHVSNDYGKINGEDLSMAELSDAVRDERNALIVSGQERALYQPNAGPQIAARAWQRLLLEREAERLHISVTDQEVVDFIRKQPALQKDGVYSPEAYAAFVAGLKNHLRLPSDSGVDPTANAQNVIESVVRNNLLVDAVTAALVDGVRSSARDVSSQYEKFYAPVTVSYATLDPKSFVAAAKVTPAEIEAEYKAHPENPAYRTKEKRKVDYVLFMLSPAQQALPDAQKTEAKNALGQQALDFALALQPEPAAGGASGPAPDFFAVAKKLELPAATTGFFDADSAPAGVPPSPAFNDAAFALTKDNPVSRVVELQNGVAVLHLAEIQASDLLPLDQVKEVIARNLQESKGEEAAKSAAATDVIRLRIQLAMKGDFKAEAAALGLKVATLPPFVPMNSQSADQLTQSLAVNTLSLKPGELSDPIPGPDGGTIIAHLDARGAADPAGLAAFEKRFRGAQDEELRQQALADWTEWKSNQPGTHRPPDLDAFGSVE